MNIKDFADQISWDLDEIGILNEIQRSLLKREAIHIRERLTFRGKAKGERKTRTFTFQIGLYWAQEADVVLWAVPPTEIYHRGILFNSYDELSLWLPWVLRSRFRASTPELKRVHSVVNAWRVKVTHIQR